MTEETISIHFSKVAIGIIFFIFGAILGYVILQNNPLVNNQADYIEHMMNMSIFSKNGRIPFLNENSTFSYFYFRYHTYKPVSRGLLLMELDKICTMRKGEIIPPFNCTQRCLEYCSGS